MDTPKKMIERRERERYREGGRDKRERGERDTERVKGRGIERESERKKIERKRRFLLQFLIKYPERRSGKKGLNIGNKMYVYIILFLLQNYKNLKKNL